MVVGYGSSGLLAENLTGLVVGRDCGRVVVVDNFTTAGEQASLCELAGQHGWELLLSSTNLGFGAGCNRGAAHALAAGSELLLLLNPDARIGAEQLAALAEQVDADPTAVVTPRLVRPDGTDWFRAGRLDLATGQTRTLGTLETSTTVPWLTAACLAVHGSLWQRVEGFDESYFLYWEDVDLSHRCRLAGARLLVRDDLTAVHEVGATQGTGKSRLYYFSVCRGRLAFAARHVHGRALLRWVLATPSYTRLVLLRGGRRAVRPAAVWSALVGTVAGMRLVVAAAASRRSGDGARPSP